LVRDITERKRVERKLAEAAQRFEIIFEESPVAKLVLDPAFRVLQANAAAIRLLGQEADTVKGTDPRAFLGDRVQPAVTALIAQLAQGATMATASDQALRRGDGRTVWCKLTLRAWDYVLDPDRGDRSELHYLLVLEDLTERRHADEQLRTVLRDQQILLETMSAGVVQAVQGRVTLANREFGRMFGVDQGDVIGMSLWDLANDRQGQMPYEVTGLPAVRPNQTTSAEVVLFRADGEPIWCLVQARPIAAAEETGEAAGIDEADVSNVAQTIYTFQDISEMKRQREALTRSLLELNVVLDTTAVAVLHLSGSDIADGEVMRCNAQAYHMFGGSGQDIVGRRFATLMPHEEQVLHHREAMRAPLAQGDLYSFETQLRGRSGEPFWALVSLRAVDPRAAVGAGQGGTRGTAGFGLIASVLDISQRRAQEEQLQALLAESQLLFETALVGLLFVRDGRAVRANTAMEELLACESGDLTDQGQLFTHPTDQLLMGALAERFAHIHAEGMVEFEMLLYRRRGDPLWVAVQGRAVNAVRPDLGYVFAFVNIDERKRTERELRSTLGELQLIFDNTLAGMMYVSSGLIVKANDATQRMLGYDQRDFSELSIDLVFAETADWRELSEALAQACESSDEAERSQGISFERLARRADGSAFWCAGNVRPLDPAQPTQGLIIALMDVDARHRSEDELRRVRNYLDLVVEHLPVLVSVREAASGRFVSLNRAGESITGLAREQVIGRTWHEVYGRQFADLYVELDRKALADGTQIDRPRDVMLRADGRRLTVNHRVVPMFEPHFDGDDSQAQEARYVMSIIDDLTEEVRAEALLAETETRFRQFAENIDQVVFIATADLAAVLYVNPRYSALVGGQVDELFEDPRNVLAHVHADDLRKLMVRLPRVVAHMRRLRKQELTVRIHHPLRGTRSLHVRFNPVRMVADGTVRVFGIAEDVTQRVAEEKQRIEDALRQRDILVREVHHRIKNNLQGVAGLLQHMATSKPELAVYLDEIASQIQAIAQVHGLQIRATGTLPILGVVQGIFGSLSTMFGVSIQLETPPPALWRWGLPEQEAVPLALTINELGTNAIKYRSHRDAPIGVRLNPLPYGIELLIENPGQLAEGFDLARISAGVSGLGLIKALLPRRGARLSIEQHGARVLTRLELSAPAIGEDTDESVGEGPA
ncbi:MAG TPA: PAS domain S-box protein, partial [Burkholderiaceae bacterium]|nr:PAS domain S-box protein [Burkholderiaceae bacterium]